MTEDEWWLGKIEWLKNIDWTKVTPVLKDGSLYYNVEYEGKTFTIIANIVEYRIN